MWIAGARLGASFRDGGRLVLFLGVFASVIVLVPVCHSRVWAGQSSSELLARWDSEAAAAWKTVDAGDESPCTIKMRTSIRQLSPGKPAKEVHKEAMIRRREGGFVFESTTTPLGVFIATGWNTEYDFFVSRDEGKAEWRVNEIRLKGHKGFRTTPADIIQYVKPNGYCFVPTLGPLSSLYASKRLKASKAELLDHDQVRIHITLSFEIGPRQFTFRGWMDFDPANAWALTRAEFHDGENGILSGSKRFATNPRNGYRECEFWETRGKASDGTETVESVDFETVASDGPAMEFFTLSHYGLSEPAGVPPLVHSSSAPWVLLGFAGILAIVGGGWYLHRRRRPPSTI